MSFKHIHSITPRRARITRKTAEMVYDCGAPIARKSDIDFTWWILVALSALASAILIQSGALDTIMAAAPWN